MRAAFTAGDTPASATGGGSSAGCRLGARVRYLDSPLGNPTPPRPDLDHSRWPTAR
jgi:hypothetical protein